MEILTPHPLLSAVCSQTSPETGSDALWSHPASSQALPDFCSEQYFRHLQLPMQEEILPDLIMTLPDLHLLLQSHCQSHTSDPMVRPGVHQKIHQYHKFLTVRPEPCHTHTFPLK